MSNQEVAAADARSVRQQASAGCRVEIVTRGSVPKYKNIKSVAHNLGHSFLSDMNLAGTWPDIVMVPDVIYQAARASGEPVVRIDFFQGTVEPSAVVLT